MSVSITQCIACFEALDSSLTGHPATPLSEINSLWPLFTSAIPNAPVGPPVPAITGTAPISAPLFVTWNIHPRPPSSSSADGPDLRGCIGTFEPLELGRGLKDYAITAALYDSRFDPIAKSELPRLQVGVTLLADFEECEDKWDWEIGTHGIIIKFKWNGRSMTGTYLPDVIPEQGWTQEETLVHLMQKAGWRGNVRDWEEVDLKVTRYQGKKCKAEYADYKLWKDWYAKHKAESK